MREDVSLEGKVFGYPAAYWTLRNGAVVEGSHPADLAEASASPNVDMLGALIGSIDPAPTATVFQGVHRVPNDSTVTIHADGSFGARRHRRHLEIRRTTPLEAADEIWRLILQSVERAVRGAKHVAVAIARGASPKEVTAVTLDFGGEGDDRPHMRELERALGLVAVRIDPTEYAPGMRAQLNDARMPMLTPTAPTDFALAQVAAKSGADVLLTGMGGDDLFDGYPRLFVNDLFAHPIETVSSVLQLRSPSRTAAEHVVELLVRPLGAHVMPTSLRAARRASIQRLRFPWAGPKLRELLETDARSWRPAALDTPAERFDVLAKAPFLDRPLELIDELARANEIRVAHPYLDEGLLELTASLPPAVLMHGHRLRGLFRLAARGALPDSVRLRPDKASFADQRRRLFAAAGGLEPFRDLATMEECARLGLVDPERFGVAFRAFEREATTDDLAWNWIWPAITVEAFLRARAMLARAC